MRTKSFFSVAATLLLLVNVTFSQIFPDSIQVSAWNSFKKNNPGQWNIRWNEKTGTPASIYMGKTKPYQGNSEHIAKTFLKEITDLLKIKPDISNLILIRKMTHHGISDVTFQETYNGIPIEGAEYQVHIELDGSVDMANGTYYPVITAPTTAQVTEDGAMSIIKANLGKAMVVSGKTAGNLVIYPDSNKFLLAWKISVGTEQPYGAWTYFIDAISGNIIFKQNDILFVTGYGNVYPTSPNLSSITNVPFYRLDGSGLSPRHVCKHIE